MAGSGGMGIRYGGSRMNTEATDKVTARLQAIGARLKEARELAGLSVGQVTKLFAEAIELDECNPMSVTTFESGDRQLFVTEVYILADFYGASSDWLLTGVNPLFREDEITSTVRGLSNMTDEDRAKTLRILEITTRE